MGDLDLEQACFTWRLERIVVRLGLGVADDMQQQGIDGVWRRGLEVGRG
jgi:hypothetical protein